MTKEPKTRQSKGGEARAAALDPSRRSQIARDAAKARWRHRDGQALEDEMIGSVEGAPSAPTLPPPGTGKTLDGRCGDCSTVWVVAVLPMNLSGVAKLAAKACCQACGSKKVFVALAKPEGGES